MAGRDDREVFVPFARGYILPPRREAAPWDTSRDPKGRPLQQPEERPGAWKLVIDHRPRCWECGLLLTEFFYSRPWAVRCKDGHENRSGEAEPILNA